VSERLHIILLPLGLLAAFLVHFNTQVLVRAKKGFNYFNGSIGNFFFTGARQFFGSLEAAIFLFSSIARIAPGTQVLPVIDMTFDRCTLGARLQNGSIVIGQNQISHPGQGFVQHLLSSRLGSNLPIE